MKARQKRPALWWARLTAVLAAALALGWALLNLIVDPFGVFGDRLLGWWAYNETRNPQTAKFSYLEQHHGEYDSYVVGGPSAGAWDKALLDQYFGADFYNLALNTQDVGVMERYVRHIVARCEVKNLVLSLSIDSAVLSGPEESSLSSALPCQLDGSSPLAYYARYLFANPRYSVSKLLRLRTDSIVPNAFDVFNGDTGAIDYSAQDVEAIGTVTLEEYLAARPAFTQMDGPLELAGLRACVDSVAAIRQLCEQEGVTLVVAVTPVYAPYLARVSQGEREEFFTALAQTGPCWDFTASPVSWDPRYFYTPANFRTSVAQMMLGRIFDDPSVYCPEGFGRYITADSAAVTPPAAAPDPGAYTAQVPILMYHHLSEATVSGERLDEHLAALAGAGYTSVTFEELRAYVERGTPLPDKPVVITFDDGYLSNLDIGLPILEQHGTKATIYVIGCSVGKDTYKDTGKAMTPHFSLDEAKEAADSGLITIASHGYDIHEVQGRDPDPIRTGVLQREDETEAQYAAFLRQDCAQFNQLMEPVLGRPADVLAYPYGRCSVLSEILLAQEGFYTTVTTMPGGNTVIKGLPQTLRSMNRYDLETMDLTGEELLDLLAGQG